MDVEVCREVGGNEKEFDEERENENGDSLAREEGGMHVARLDN